MSGKINKDIDQLLQEETEEEDDFTDEDFGIIISPTGELKTLLMPNDYFEIPDIIIEICHLFGINDPEDIYHHTIH